MMEKKAYMAYMEGFSGRYSREDLSLEETVGFALGCAHRVADFRLPLMTFEEFKSKLTTYMKEA